MSWKKAPVWLAVGALAVVGLLASACGSDKYEGPMVVMLGFDGMDYGITRRLMDEGRLPNFSALERQGGFAPLGTAVPPQSPVAWSNLITGMDAGGHGIYDFVHRHPETLAPYLSTSRAKEPRTLDLFGWEIPLGAGGEVELLRQGEAFWEVLERNGIESHIYRMPANYPPSGKATRELSGMGTPDLLGTPGTFSFYTSDLFTTERAVDGGHVYTVDLWDDRVEGRLHGPEELTETFEVYLDPEEPFVTLVIGDADGDGEERVLEVGEWSDWVPIDFELGALTEVRGIARFRVLAKEPEFEMYVSPINIDPMDPEQPISTPHGFAADLARAGGRFYTQNMPEDTKALSAEIFDYELFLDQAKVTGDEIRAQYEQVLAGFDGDFLFFYFGNLDQISHMMFRTLDPEHPAYDPEIDGPYADVLPQIYEEFDRIVGYTLERLPADAKLIVMSDHGFASWRRTFRLNTWLVENGYLVLKDETREKSNILENADWSRTRAYGLGLNGLYLNLAGRERNGSVTASEREELLRVLTADLLAVVDPATGEPAITKVYRREEVYSDRGHLDVGPDLLVGYAKGVRSAGSSAIGDVEPGVFSDNTGQWSGDHCMDHETVPGLIATNQPLARPAADLKALHDSILAEFGLDVPDGADAATGG